MKTCVAIPTLGRTLFAYNLVMALLAGTRAPDEILLVDQTEPEKRNPFAWKGLKRLAEQGLCRIVEHPVKSLTVARNVAVRNSDADLFIYVDDDAFIPQDFVEAYLELFQDPSIDAATGMILVGEADNGTIDTGRVHPSVHDGHTMLRGGNFAIRRNVMIAVGGMDENLIGAASHEDLDLAWRLHQHGAKVVWAARPWLFHLCYQGGGGRIANPMKHRNHAYNMCYSHLRRHGGMSLRDWAVFLRRHVFHRQSLARFWELGARMADLWQGYQLAKQAAAAGPRLPLKNG